MDVVTDLKAWMTRQQLRRLDQVTQAENDQLLNNVCRAMIFVSV